MRAVGFIASYGIWVLIVRLIALTLITYFLRSSTPKLQEISDAFASNEIMLMGLSSLLFVILLRFLNPLTSTTTQEILTPHRLEKRFLPGFLHGAVLAFGIILSFLLSGIYRYLGFFIQFDEAPFATINVFLRIASLGVLAYCEEFIFRHKIMGHLRRQLPDFSAAILTAFAYCGVKLLQFDLGWMHLITLFLLSINLSIMTIVDGDFARGAGLWAGLMIVFHPLLSLPLFGNDFPGILLVKYQLSLEHPEMNSMLSRFLTGGLGGPLSSCTLQLLLLITAGQSLYRHKKILLKVPPQRIK